jgi:hypothetical protein
MESALDGQMNIDSQDPKQKRSITLAMFVDPCKLNLISSREMLRKYSLLNRVYFKVDVEEAL